MYLTRVIVVTGSVFDEFWRHWQATATKDRGNQSRRISSRREIHVHMMKKGTSRAYTKTTHRDQPRCVCLRVHDDTWISRSILQHIVKRHCRGTLLNLRVSASRCRCLWDDDHIYASYYLFSCSWVTNTSYAAEWFYYLTKRKKEKRTTRSGLPLIIVSRSLERCRTSGMRGYTWE